MTEPDLLTSKQAAEIAGVTRGTVNKWCLDGDLETIRPGVEYLIPRAALLRFLESPRKRPGHYDRTTCAEPRRKRGNA